MNRKKVLIVYFTQSGQMRSIAESFAGAFANNEGYELVYEELKPLQPYPFPWTAFSFFNGFPEVFKEKPIALAPFSERLKEQYDLIILAWQPWFLTPAPALSTFLQSVEGQTVLKGAKVATITGCRNMWLGAREKLKRRLQANGSVLVANVALVDKSPNVVSLITILRWMLRGRKEPFWIFPAAGVSDADVANCAHYGQMLRSALENDEWLGLQQKLNESGAVEIVPELVMMESRGQRAFGIWSRFIGAAPPGSVSRKFRVYTFMFLLPTAILILSPLLILSSALMLRLRRNELGQRVEYYKSNDLK